MKHQHRATVSVIIPTLQKAVELDSLVRDCAAHPAVLEVIVVNNAAAPLAWDHAKVRVLAQGENIYVNPAWNLGAREAKGEVLAILNDDISFDRLPFDEVCRWLANPLIGLIGAHASSYDGTVSGRPRLRPAYHRPRGYGIAMFLRRNSYVPIPEDMKIWFGDDWLFSRQKGWNMTLLGVPIHTDMSVTSISPRLAPIIAADEEAVRRHGAVEGVYHRLHAWERDALRAVRRGAKRALRLG